MSTWVFVDGVLFAPEEMALDALTWRWADGGLPVLITTWQAGDLQVTSRLFAAGDVDLSDIKDCLRVEVSNQGAEAVEAVVYLVLRSFGAAGGPVNSLAFRDGVVLINGGSLVYPDTAPTRFGAMSYADTAADISVLLRRGELPEAAGVEDESGWASGALEYRLTLAPGESRALDFAFHLHAGNWWLDWLKPPARPLRYEDTEAAFLDGWRATITPRIDVPDARFAEAFTACATQLLGISVGDAPRISPLTYPLWWVRDCSYAVVAMDRAGLHDFAGRACRDAVRIDPKGGFGNEADVPGQLIWMLSEHYLLTGDEAYLRDVYPYLRAKADLLVRALHTTVPLRQPDQFVVREHALRPDVDLFCKPARDGLIQGRMDFGMPHFFVNGFAYLGLIRVALCARALGEDPSLYDAEADALRAALHRFIPDEHAGFGRNERDFCSAFWPTGWASPDEAHLRARFDEYWDETRCPGGVHHPEPLWTYFEVGEAHNQLLLGRRDRLWVSLDHFLSHHSAPGLYTWHESDKDENTAQLLWEKTRGWDSQRWVTPHGWTAAEMILLLRDCLVREDDDALVLGSGVPASWMDKPFSARDLPTHFGRVSFSYEPTSRCVRVSVERTPPGGLRTDFPLHVAIVE